MHYLFHICITIFILFQFSSALSRDSPKVPIPGTQNWEMVQPRSRLFSPRHSHATCIFPCPNSRTKNCIWLTGGYSEQYRTFDLQMSDRNADVWFSEDGSEWTQVESLNGDYLQGVGNHDAKVGGNVAPWYSRYGHSLNAIDGDGDGTADIMILTGGFDPIVSNDVWITTNGITWMFDGYAPWPKRAYHGAEVYKGELWIMGGTPLTNDIWIGRPMMKKSNKSQYYIAWRMHTPHTDSGSMWSPRAAFCTVTQLRREAYPLNEIVANSEENSVDSLFVIGGFGGYPNEDKRTRNDVWFTPDGSNWTQISPPNLEDEKMPWGSRGWHACKVWHDKDDRSTGVSQASKRFYKHHMPEKKSLMYPKIYLMGGGYLGTHGNNEVRYINGYTDVWWTLDGSEWHRVDYEEGKKVSLYSTSEVYETIIEKEKSIYLGKWGMRLELLHTNLYSDDTGKDCVDNEESKSTCTSQISNLVVIGGDTTDGGPIVNDVFISRSGVFCELGGEMCSGRGTCGGGSSGCICDSDLFIGEFCEIVNATYDTSNGSLHMSNLAHVFYVALASFLLYLFLD